MAKKLKIDMAQVEREVGEIPGSVREALLAFCEGRGVRAIAREAFGRQNARDEIDALIQRLDAMSFDAI
jgi:hypothetical protein